ncbi:serine protease 53-like [Triplophysa rosa]|uniref:serine protease 53-like n=1 Tax=Triplophysa rosa TaxID=992332 RepID=UPI00254600EE|nr:serine protease 53-like [Triplophysa rosa]
MIVISLLLLGSLLPNLSFSASVNVGIVNGTEARPHSRPYMVSVQKNGRHVCGGFLISSKFVLTAAHCQSDGALTVLAGVHDLTKKGDTMRFSAKSYYEQADLMILELDESVQLNDYIKTIRIPTGPTESIEDTNCTVSGWGDITIYGPLSLNLREANVQLMSDDVCKRQWGHEYIDSQMMCVYGYGGTCNGDSGGPLVCGNTAVGVTYFGSPYYCNDPDRFNVYTKISAFLPWIRKITVWKQKMSPPLPFTVYCLLQCFLSEISPIIILIMIVISLLLLDSLLPHLSFTASVNVGIVNGTEARPHSRPYMVSVQQYRSHKCGGFLISDQFVMTAAHCRDSTETLTVVAGAHDLSNKYEKSVRIGVSSYEKHPSYKPAPELQADIMILKLDQTVKLNKNIKTIPIPTTPEDIKKGTRCSVAGWGRLKTKSPASPKLIETNVKIMSKTGCARRWDRSYIASKMMCVYGHGGSCDGDSGGPLVCGNTAVGVTSFGSSDNCNDPNKPEVYTEISAFLPWIHNVINSYYY